MGMATHNTRRQSKERELCQQRPSYLWVPLYADRTVLYPMLEVIAAEFNLSGTATGFITSTYFLLYVIVQVPADSLRYPWLKRFYWSFYFRVGALFLLGLLAQNYLFLIVLVGLHGIGIAYYPTLWHKHWYST